MKSNSDLRSEVAGSDSNDYVQAMEHLVSVIQELSLARNLEAIMAVVRRAARTLTGADGATFVLRENGLCHYADEDAIEPLWKGKRFPMETCISGWVMLNAKPAVIEDIYNDPRIPAVAYRPTFVKSLAMVPIRSIEPVGAIGTYWATRHCPRPEHIKILQALANSASVAMENVQLYAGLEQKVAERTARLQLLNEELDGFTQSVTHDLSAPLRRINGFIELLERDLDGKLGTDGAHYMDAISRSARSMEGLIRDLLKFSQTGRAELYCAPVDMNALVAEVWQELAGERKNRDIEWQVDDLPNISGDRALLKQVWANLLSNAVKYTSRRPAAKIHVGAVPSDGETEFFVKDNGAGFDMRFVNKLFKVFQRLHRTDEFEGTGVGLANVRRIVLRHGGRVWAVGELDAGSTFFFTLAKAGVNVLAPVV